MGVTVALVEDSLIVREGIAQVLRDGLESITLMALCDGPEALLRLLEHDRPEVVVTDIRMPPTHTDEGIRLARSLRASHPGMGVVVLSNYAEPEYALALMDAGSERRAYLLKERIRDGAQLRSAVLTVAAGGSMIDPRIVETLMATRGHAWRASPLADLTVREREVLAQLAAGRSNGAIAGSLVVSKRAVEKHINAIFLKLGLADDGDVSKRVTAALMFLADASPPVAHRT